MKPHLCATLDDHDWEFCEGDDHGIPDGDYCLICGVRREDAMWAQADREADEAPEKGT